MAEEETTSEPIEAEMVSYPIVRMDKQMDVIGFVQILAEMAPKHTNWGLRPGTDDPGNEILAFGIQENKVKEEGAESNEEN